jgi:hypothetical protein
MLLRIAKGKREFGKMEIPELDLTIEFRDFLDGLTGISYWGIRC